jgi:hypothetical protein
MFDPSPDPISGKYVLDWAAPVTRALNAIGDKVGAAARNERDRRTSARPLPFEVRWDATLGDGAGGYKIYLPTGHLLSYAGEDIAASDISGATPISDANGDDTAWSVLDEIGTSADHVWLVMTIPDESAADAEEGEDGGGVEAEFSSEEGQDSEGATVLNICIAEVSYEAPEGEGASPTVEIKQSVVGALHLGGGEPAVDDVSIDANGDEGGLQIKDFNTDESDSPEGLVERMRVDTETGDVSLESGSNIMLVARRGGKIVYIPLSADGEDPEDEKPEDSIPSDPCGHPGGGGGVSPGDDDGGGHGGGGAGGGGGGGGGVAAGGEPHTGDDNCNCN